MRRIALFAAGIGLFAPLMASAPAQAQATRTWVSGVGDDANPCSRTAPCKTFPGAISKTAASGEINCLDPAGFGAVTITKSISIVCQHTLGGILSAGTTGVIINALATDEIILKGLDINGTNTGLNGIRMIAGGSLTVEDTIIANTTGWGIQLAASTPMSFQITRVTVTNNVLGGMQVRPTAAAAVATGVITGFTAHKNPGKGIELDGNGGGPSNTMIRNSVFNKNDTGISAVTGATQIGAMVTDTAIMSNATSGINGAANTFVRVGRSEISGNGAGVSGTVSSFGTNQLRGNGSDGTLTLLSPATQ